MYDAESAIDGDFTPPFPSFSDAARENARSRIFLGIHWQFDADEGVAQGIKIGDAVTTTLLLPLP